MRVKHSLMNVALSGDRKEFWSPHSAGPWLKPTLLLESYALTGGVLHGTVKTVSHIPPVLQAQSPES
jgi:hypothetical protein